MTTQPEQILENNLVAQLVQLGYERVLLPDEPALLRNLKTQLEKHNKVVLSEQDFRQILNALNKGNIFERAKTLRERVLYTNDAGERRTVELINQIHWCQNEFQVAQQITMEGSYKNRYDVTLLINGLPLVQIELKRRGLDMKEAFNQVNRYERHSYSAGQGLFQFVQLFVISNGVNTKYFANNPLKGRSFKQTFFWADEKNKLITQLADFADSFLEPCHISKMITKYIVLNESQKLLMVLRPYQFYATEAIVEKVKNTGEGAVYDVETFGHIWHTTGSGKTLTSFKTAQILTGLPQVHKVVFVVDRRDLDYQTTKEFNSFSEGSIDSTNDTQTLVKQLSGDQKLIVTTVQKLHTAISKTRYLGKIEDLRKRRIVFIFDECHRSQFGKTHEEIRRFFANSQLFGFTGTPVFKENAGLNNYGRRTTAMLFGKSLHKYIITDAIRDHNVLKFSVEYISTFRKKEEILDINVEAIDEAEVMNAPQRMSNIVDYILANHDRKTHGRQFTAIFCVSSVDALIAYYQLFQEKQASSSKPLRLATIYSYQANENDKDATGMPEEEEFEMAAEPEERYQSQHSRDHLDAFIAQYNKDFGTNFSTRDSKSFDGYYKDIARRVKHQQIDLLLVVNMFLTGFDSKHLNTLYVDKNLKYHGLIQAYSRTNRILDEVKSQGNIVCFRNLKAATDEAVALFATRDATSEIITPPYEDFVLRFNEAFQKLMDIAPTVDSVNDLEDEEAEAEFIKAFRQLMRLKNVLNTFTEYEAEDVQMSEQAFDDYKSKYLDLYEKTKDRTQKEKVSILNDIDFELELIHRDEINVAYILRLLANLKDAAPEEQERQKQAIMAQLSNEVKLRSKRLLIEQFIQEHLPLIEDSDQIPDAFEVFWNEARSKALAALSQTENLHPEKLEALIGAYLFSEKEPLRHDILDLMLTPPALKERSTSAERITGKIFDFVETFINDMAGG